MGGESEGAWRAMLDDLIVRGLQAPELLIVDGALGLEKALAALWPAVPLQRCTVHKHRNLLAHAPDRLHEELSNDYRDMISASTCQEIEARRKAFLREWWLKCRAVATALRKPATNCSRSHAFRKANGNRSARATPSSDCTRTSAADQTGPVLPCARDGGDAVLGFARLRTDRHAKSRWLAHLAR